jgi:hypothetical protein
MQRDRYINASEIGNYKFCKRAWHLARLNAPSEAVIEREAGIARHERHAEKIRSAARSHNVSRVFGVAALVLLVVLLLYRMLFS